MHFSTPLFLENLSLSSSGYSRSHAINIVKKKLILLNQTKAEYHSKQIALQNGTENFYLVVSGKPPPILASLLSSSICSSKQKRREVVLLTLRGGRASEAMLLPPHAHSRIHIIAVVTNLLRISNPL